MSVAVKKKKIRSQMQRIKLTSAVRSERSQRICKLIKRSSAYCSASSIAFFAGLSDEPDLFALARSAKKDGKKIFFPRMSRNQISFCEVRDVDQDLSPGRYGVLEPRKQVSSQTKSIDLVLVPGRAFDLNKYRLGRGGGHYDRALASLKKSRKAGVAFCEQLIVAVPVETHDVPMDLLFVA